MEDPSSLTVPEILKLWTEDGWKLDGDHQISKTQEIADAFRSEFGKHVKVIVCWLPRYGYLVFNGDVPGVSVPPSKQAAAKAFIDVEKEVMPAFRVAYDPDEAHLSMQYYWKIAPLNISQQALIDSMHLNVNWLVAVLCNLQLRLATRLKDGEVDLKRAKVALGELQATILH